jgi:spore germination protein YaaH
MRDAASLAATYGATPTYNDRYGETTFSYQKVYNGTTDAGLATSCTASRTAWYQDAKSWALRAALVTKYRIGGITAWTFRNGRATCDGIHSGKLQEILRRIK